VQYLFYFIAPVWLPVQK